MHSFRILIPIAIALSLPLTRTLANQTNNETAHCVVLAPGAPTPTSIQFPQSSPTADESRQLSRPAWCSDLFCEIKIAFIHDSDDFVTFFAEEIAERQVSIANQVFRASRLPVTLTIVAVESDPGLASADVINSDDNPTNPSGLHRARERLPDLRESVGADVVFAIVWSNRTSTSHSSLVTGVAYSRLPGQPARFAAEWAAGAFAIWNMVYLATDQLYYARPEHLMSLELAHELGHILGLQHQPNEVDTIEPFAPHGRGYRGKFPDSTTELRTVMYSPGSTSILRQRVYSDVGIAQDLFRQSHPAAVIGVRGISESRKALLYTIPDASRFAEGGPYSDERLSGGDGGSGNGDDPADGDGDASGSPYISCDEYVTPYWRGSGGFVVSPNRNRVTGARVTIECGDRVLRERLYPSDDGIIVQLVESHCVEGGEPLEGTIKFRGIEDGGWYWLDGEHNAPTAPLVCNFHVDADDFDNTAVVPDGVVAVSSDHGTLITHLESEVIGIIPHITEPSEQQYTVFWRGRGGIVGRTTREYVKVRVQCGRTWSSSKFYSSRDGLVTGLIDREFCFDREGRPKAGFLRVDGFEPGGWYWIAEDGKVAVAPLMPYYADGLPPVHPEEMDATVDDGGTLFSYDAINLFGIVPRMLTY